MQRVNKVNLSGPAIDDSVPSLAAGEDLTAGDDPRAAIARLNKEIVAYQSAGRDVPTRLMRLSKALALECAMQSQGR